MTAKFPSGVHSHSTQQKSNDVTKKIRGSCNDGFFVESSDYILGKVAVAMAFLRKVVVAITKKM